MKTKRIITGIAVAGCIAAAGGGLAAQKTAAHADVSELQSSFVMESGMSLRLSAPEGLRFRASISQEEKTSYGENAKYGILMLPESLLGNAELEIGTNGEAAIEKTLVVEAKSWYSSTGYSCVVAAQQDKDGNEAAFPEEFYNVPIVARGYAIDENGAVHYTASSVTRSIGYVAKLCEIEGLTTAEETKELYKGVAVIAAGVTSELTLNGGEDLWLGDTYAPQFTIGGVAANLSDSVSVIYESDNAEVLNAENGKITAAGVGTAEISAYLSVNGGEKQLIAQTQATVKGIASLRTGDDENTLFFFDRAEGVRQLSERGPAGISAEHSVEMKKTGENGATKLTFPGTEAHNWINYDLCGYEYAEDDYAVFYIYNNANTDFISLLFGYSNGVILRKGEWTMVARKVSELNGNYFRFYGQNFVATNGNSEASNTGAELAGSVYISEAKVYPASAVQNLTKQEKNSIWSVGNTQFKGSVSSYYGDVTGNGLATGLINNAMERDAYLVNGEFRSALWAHSYAGFYATLAQSVDMSTEDMYVAITIKGAIEGKFSIHAMGASGEYDTLYGTLSSSNHIAGAEGYVTYLFCLPKKADKTLNGLRITPCGSTEGSCGSREIRISDIFIGNAAAMNEKGLLA